MIKRLIYLTLFLLTTHANAALLNVDNGILMGADGVEVDGILYDVNFVDGACVDGFMGCDELSDLDFNDFNIAHLAAQALLDQVFVDGIEGNFDSETTNIFGCGSAEICVVYVPYDITDYFNLPGVNTRYAYNLAGNQADSVGNNLNNANAGLGNYGTKNSDVYARFTVSDVAIPEPSTLAIFSLGIIGLALLRFKKQ